MKLDNCNPGGDLYEELKRCGGHLSEDSVARDVLQPCLCALVYLHSKVILQPAFKSQDSTLQPGSCCTAITCSCQWHISNGRLRCILFECCASADPNKYALGEIDQLVQGFLWRDCKPENILLAGKGISSGIKLADFGLSIDATEERPVTRAGTLDYMAPEVSL